MTAPTPGPWAVCEKAPNDHWLAGCTVYSVPLGKRVCDASILNAEYTANAHVMAAAPEMLALLRDLIDIEGPQPGTSDWAAKVQAVIAKATAGK